jgi:2-keto-4-pentenoate hydratase/2-oxohepta-3-ene-1,7-dioic acid hydratase in catechol pathway
MLIASIRRGASRAIVVGLPDGAAYDVTGSAGGPGTIAQAMHEAVSGTLARRLIDCEPINLTAQTLLRPIDDDARILCAGFNFATHASESDRQSTPQPTFFTRYASSVVGPSEPIVRPTASECLDWEGELAVVIGRGGRAIPRERALSHVGGYVCFGDHSVRDFQQHGTQATAGKNFDRSGAIGPWIITPDQAPPPEQLQVFTRLNGEPTQHGRLAQLVFDIPALIAYASTFMALRPGDVIATGTPSGIGARRTPPRWLRSGDEIAIEVPGVGLLVSRVIDEKGTDV